MKISTRTKYIVHFILKKDFSFHQYFLTFSQEKYYYQFNPFYFSICVKLFQRYNFAITIYWIKKYSIILLYFIFKINILFFIQDSVNVLFINYMNYTWKLLIYLSLYKFSELQWNILLSSEFHVFNQYVTLIKLNLIKYL